LLGSVSDPALVSLLEEMIAEAEAHLQALDERPGENSRAAPDRIRSVARDASRDSITSLPLGPVTYIANWRLDLRNRAATSPTGKTVRLTKGEFELLLVLVGHADQVLSREDLMALSRHRSPAPGERTVDVLIGRLRRKLETNARRPMLIKTMRGEGYIFTPRSSR
jgi:two-component system phosphate regulon response regulator OmpR